MKRIFAALPGNEHVTASIAAQLGAELAEVEFHRFPDAETYVRIKSSVEGCEVCIVCTLDRPDSKFLPLLFTAANARSLGAKRVGLVAPYLSYLRQDRRFKPGEALTSRVFADVISRTVDWLITVDPHLHRITSLDEAYRIPAVALQAAPLMSRWIRENTQSALVVGPDEESSQWAEAVAAKAGVPFVVLKKTRHGDRNVSIILPELSNYTKHTPVLIDDIISSANTMIETVRRLGEAGMKPPICIGVHGVFAPGALVALRAAGAAQVITTTSIPHETNAIDLAALLANAIPEIAA